MSVEAGLSGGLAIVVVLAGVRLLIYQDYIAGVTLGLLAAVLIAAKLIDAWVERFSVSNAPRPPEETEQAVRQSMRLFGDALTVASRANRLAGQLSVPEAENDPDWSGAIPAEFRDLS